MLGEKLFETKAKGKGKSIWRCAEAPASGLPHHVRATGGFLCLLSIFDVKIVF